MPSVEDGSFDELLGEPVTKSEKDAITSLKDDGVPAETPAEARIRELEAKIAALEATPAPALKTEEEKNREHRAAIAANTAALSAPEAFEEAEMSDPSTISFHILDTGFTFADRVWNFGQNVSIKRGGRAYQDTIDRDGKSWLDDLSRSAQFARFRKIVIGEGFWDGPAFNDAVSKLDAKRGSAAPVVTIN